MVLPWVQCLTQEIDGPFLHNYTVGIKSPGFCSPSPSYFLKMSAERPTGVLSDSQNKKSAHWRDRLHALAGREHLTCEYEVEKDKEGDFFWATYHLVNWDGTKTHLGLASGPSIWKAKEHAAEKAVRKLITLILQNGQDNTVASTSTPMNIGGSTSTAFVDWPQQLNSLAVYYNFHLSFCEGDAQGGMFPASYYCRHSDGLDYIVGSGYGANRDIAKAQAAFQAHETLKSWIPGSGTASGSGS